MAEGARLRVLIATDGSPAARAALLTARAFPWPSGTIARAVVASQAGWLRAWPGGVRAARDEGARRIAAGIRRDLAPRWPDAEVVDVDAPPVDGVLREARRFGADVIAVGWRGHGGFRRLLVGSVSRNVVRRAACSVLVVRRRPREIRRIVIGADGSEQAGRALDLAARLEPARDIRITLVHVVDPMRDPPSAGRLPGSIRAMVRHEVEAENRKRTREGERALAQAAARLSRSGRRVRTVLRTGAPLAELLEVVRRDRAHLLMIGARATSGVERALVGSVAEGALNRSPVPVLIAR